MQTNILKTIIALLLSSIVFVSCKDEDEDISTTRTVVIYMSGENNLGIDGYLSYDYNEILKGGKNMPDNVRLLVYVDNQDTNPPYITLIDKTNGEQVIKKYASDFYSSDPDNMREVLNWCYSKYPAKSYGLVLWGHGNSWLFEPDDNASSEKAHNRKMQAYGADTGQDNTTDSEGVRWMNISEMADALSRVPHLDFLFFDCCCMQTAEVAYELRNVTDYIIGSPSEIPGRGAPYDHVVPDFFLDKAIVGKNIVNDYLEYGNFGGNSGLPMSVVKTDEMDNLANATQQALRSIMPSYQYPTDIPLDSLIYYFTDNNLSAGYSINYDMRDFMKHYLTAADFNTWDNTFHKAVIYSQHPGDIHDTWQRDWMTNTNAIHIDFYSFYLTDDNYGGMSMFIPQTCYSNVTLPYISPNTSIFQTEWSNIVNWSEWGW